MVDLSVVIVNWNTRERLSECLYSIGETAVGAGGQRPEPYFCQTWVVDNGSSDDSVRLVEGRFPWVKLLVNRENRGFAEANNQALSLATGRHVLFLNPDTRVLPEALSVLCEFLDSHPRTGAVAPQMLSPEGCIQRSCRRFPTMGSVLWDVTGLDRVFPNHSLFARHYLAGWNHDTRREVDQPMGACLMVRRAALDQVGRFDERFRLFFEDVDLCRRLKSAGWDICFLPEARVVHYGGQSMKRNRRRASWLFYRSRHKYFRKHFGRYQEWLVRALMIAGVPWQLLLRLVLVLVKPAERSRAVPHFGAVAVQLAAAMWPS